MLIRNNVETISELDQWLKRLPPHIQIDKQDMIPFYNISIGIDHTSKHSSIIYIYYLFTILWQQNTFKF